jgi:hypothetical protein
LFFLEYEVPLRVIFFHFQNELMKSLLAFALLFVAPFALAAQCRDIPLGTLQVMAKSSSETREAKIVKEGFDLAAEKESSEGSGTIRTYRKCWNQDGDGNTVFRQLMVSRSNVNDVTFLTLDEITFLTLKNEIDKRHKTDGNKAVVEGKKFRYSFDMQDANGLRYYAVNVALKSKL